MTRRSFATLAGGALVWPLATRAQQPATVAQIGFLATGSLASLDQQATRNAFLQGLGERGYVEGRNVVIHIRGADGKIERFRALASELVGLKVDLIVASNTPAARAARQATTTIPIVVPVMGDPVGDGLVASLARPGGNITGLTFLGPELTPKRLELLKEMLPRVVRVIALWHPGAYGERTMAEMLERLEAAARTLGVRLEAAFAALVREGAAAVIVQPSLPRRPSIALAMRHRLPLVTASRPFAGEGGLLSYSGSFADIYRHAATYVDRVLKGSKPSDLPVGQPTKFDLVVNLKTATAPRVTVPTSILVRATEVIE